MDEEELAGVDGRVRAVVARHVGADRLGITAPTKLIEDLDLDSLDRVELSMALEDEFGVEVSADEVMNARTVGQCVHLVVQALQPLAIEVRAEQRLVEAQLAGQA